MKHAEEDIPRRPTFEIGQPLDLLSVDEIDAAIAALREEIARLDSARAARVAANAAAEAFFRK